MILPPDDYFAGHFDGDGSILMRSTHAGNWQLIADVDICCRPILEMYRRRFGGTHIRPHRTKKGNRPKWQWNITRRSEMEEFVFSLMPLVIEKAPQFAVACDWLADRSGYSERTRDRSIKLPARKYRDRLRKLKRADGGNALRISVPSDPYFAGHFDAEGCARLNFNKRTGIWSVLITLSLCHRQTLTAYAARFGGSHVRRVPLYKGDKKRKWAWYLSKRVDAAAFIGSLLPFSTEKREQLALAGRWIEHRNRLGSGKGRPRWDAFLRRDPDFQAFSQKVATILHIAKQSDILPKETVKKLRCNALEGVRLNRDVFPS